MAVPKRRKSKSKRDSRRATHKISAAIFNECPQCAAPKRPHRVCTTCGWYGSASEGRNVLPVVEVED